MIDKIPSGYWTLRTTGVRIWHEVSRTACAVVSSAPKVSCWSAEWSEQLQNLSILIVNLIASWMRLHHYRCCQKQVRMLVHSLRVLFKFSGGAGSIWTYFEVLVRTTRVSGRFAFGFWTDLHFADIAAYSAIFQVCVVHWFNIDVCPKLGMWHKELYTFENIPVV